MMETSVSSPMPAICLSHMKGLCEITVQPNWSCWHLSGQCVTNSGTILLVANS